MQFVDWDGRATQWGKLYPGAPGGDSAGYLAVLGASYLASAGRADAAPVTAYTGYLDEIDLWSGPDACGSNWNDISMLTAAFHHLIWNDPANASRWQAAFDALAHPAHSRGIASQLNAWYDVMYAAQKPLGPTSDGPAYAAVADAVCQLREFPRSNHATARDTTALAAASCTGRKDESMAQTPFSIADRCAATFAWWGNPYIRMTCSDEPSLVQNPAGYLLPYWMARYYGFVAATD
jgi:hypothetical protein